jgi:ankyrin repeat protein
LVKEFGADVNIADNKDGLTTLFLAAQEGHLDCARCLVKEFGADVNQANLNEAKALFSAT